MLYYLSEMSDRWPLVNLFRYVTFRALGGAATAFAMSLAFGEILIRRLSRMMPPARLDGVRELSETHRKKRVPTMGGLLIVGTTTVGALLWGIPTNALLWMTMAAMWAMGVVGFADDYLKVTQRNPKGLPGRWKLLAQVACAVALTSILWSTPAWRPLAGQLALPFLKTPVVLDLGVAGSTLFALLVLVGCTNAVNLTDGLDGLAVGCAGSVSTAYLVMAYCAGHAVFARYLQIPFVSGAGELAVFCGCLLGACLGFLWWNCRPARIIMGDTGSLAIGGAIAVVAMLINQELTLVLVGGVFVAEAASVLLQVGYFKWTAGRRIFRCAPIHHHFEMNAMDSLRAEGMNTELAETRVTVRMWIVSLILALAGVASLKIR